MEIIISVIASFSIMFLVIVYILLLCNVMTKEYKEEEEQEIIKEYEVKEYLYVGGDAMENLIIKFTKEVEK
jgi:uncharacterized membrane protein